MGQVELVSSSPEETEAAAARLAAVLLPGDVVAVSGELGAGKTTFVRGGARALGVSEPVTSPTYTIGHRHDGVSHLDLYRFERFTEADWAALEPYFENAVVFVEWPEAAAGRLPPPRVSVSLRHVDRYHRKLVLESAEKGLLEGIFGGGHTRL